MGMRRFIPSILFQYSEYCSLPDLDPLPVYGEKARNAFPPPPVPSRNPGLLGLGLCILLAAGLCPNTRAADRSLGLTTFTESSVIYQSIQDKTLIVSSRSSKHDWNSLVSSFFINLLSDLTLSILQERLHISLFI